jgi:SAM-dependent MidA family methyltransferase
VQNWQNSPLQAALSQRVIAAGGWLPFDDFMQAALYTPGLGYYAHGSQKFGSLPTRPAADGTTLEGSDFVTAPELSPLFGACVGQQVAQALQATGTRCVFEFGAGSGALALQICELLEQVNQALEHYFIIELSASLRARQQATLAKFGDRVQWLDALPAQMQGVVIGNEVLDAMPVKLLVRTAGVWHERGVVLHPGVMQDVEQINRQNTGSDPAPNSAQTDSQKQIESDSQATHWAWQDHPTDLRPSIDLPGSHDYLTEIHPQAEAFISTLASHLTRGAAFFIDYGFPESEYYHPQRHMGTLMCHYQHQADPDPLDRVGEKDITAHVDFSGIALAGQDAGLDVLGYANQGRFLMNCGLLQRLETLPPLQRAHAAKLATEHEMGELFKVIAFGKGTDFEPIGFAAGDRTHTL